MSTHYTPVIAHPEDSPALPPSPMGPMNLVSTTMRLILKAPGLLVGTVLAQIAVGLLLMLVPIIAVVALVVGIGMSSGNSGTTDGSFALGMTPVIVIGYVLALIGPIWAQVKYGAMQVVIVDQAARGMEPSWEAANQHTKGIFRRALSVFLIVIGLVVVAGLIGGGLGFAIGQATQDGTSSPGLAIAMVVLMLAFTLVALWLAVRLTYVTQVLAVERRSGMDVLRRSMQLTKGRWWATLGNQIVGGLALYVVAVIAIAITAALTSQKSTQTLGITLGILVYLLLVLFASVWMTAFTTTMYIDQVRRHVQQGIGIPPIPGMAGGQWGGGAAPIAQDMGQQRVQAPLDEWGQDPSSVAAPGLPTMSQPQQTWAPADAEPTHQIPGEEPTRSLPLDEPTTQINGQENTHHLPRDPWARPDEEE